MGIAAIIIGALAMFFYLVSLLPLLRIVDVLTLPLAVVGIILGAIGIGIGSFVVLSIIGLILSAVVFFFAFGRLTGHRPVIGRPI